MTFQNDDGEILDFDGKFAITRRAVSFLNSKIQGDFSVNFDVDNNSVNRKVLGYDGPQMVNQVAFTRQSFTLIRNGNPFMKGFIVIQSDNGATLSCFFMSGNSNWLNMVQGLITELDFTGVLYGVNYETQLESSVITAAMHNTSGNVFPLIDWAYGFNKGSDLFFDGTDLVDMKVDPLQSIMDYYPCFYVHTLVSEIVKQNGLKISGSLLTNSIYQKLIIPPVSGQIKRPDVKVTTAYGSTFSTSSGTPVVYDQFAAGSNPEGLFANDRYTANRNAKVIVTITIVTATVPAGSTLIFAPSFDGVSGVGTTYTTAVSVTNVSVVSEVVVLTGQTLMVAVVRGGAAGTVDVTLNIKFDVPTQITSNDFLTPDLYLPKLSCVDIIKFVVNYFGCTCSYDELSKTITINVIEGLKKEDAQDWSEYYQSHKANYTIDGAANNYQRLADPNADPKLAAYNKARIVKYGEGNLQTGNTLKEGADFMQIPFAPSDFSLCKNQIWQSSVPIIKLQDAGEPIPYQSISNGGGNNQFNYTFDYLFSNNVNSAQLVRIVDDTQGDVGIYTVLNGGAGAALANGMPYWGYTSTGKLYLQEIVYQTITPRILINKSETSVSDFGSSLVNLIGSARSFAHFTKPSTGLNIDKYKANAAFDNPDGNFTDPAINELYFSKIKRMIGNPVIPAVFKLPESVFQSFDFQSFIYLKTKDLTGYFWVDSIINYQDGATDVEVKLLML